MHASGPGHDFIHNFEILEHTADVGLVARGRTLGEAFAAAGYALSALVADLSQAKPRQSREVAVEGQDPGSLLVAWLSELLYLFDAEGFLSLEFDITHIDARSLRAIVLGDSFDPERHRPNMAVKAISYHQLEVQHADGYEARVYLDV